MSDARGENPASAPGREQTGLELSSATVKAIKAALQASAYEVGRARHDYPPIHDFQEALDEVNAATESQQAAPASN